MSTRFDTSYSSTCIWCLCQHASILTITSYHHLDLGSFHAFPHKYHVRRSRNLAMLTLLRLPQQQQQRGWRWQQQQQGGVELLTVSPL